MSDPEAAPHVDLSVALLKGVGSNISVFLKFEPPYDAADFWIQLANKIISDSGVLYLAVHDWEDARRLHRERPSPFLMLYSEARGAHWITYFCNEYVTRLGGRETLLTAPAWQIRDLPSGTLIISHPDPCGLGQEPKASEIARLNDFLHSLVDPEERP